MHNTGNEQPLESDPELAGHDLDEDGEHDSEECYACLHEQATSSSCRCGKCCHLLIEVDVRDAEREPKIAEHGSPIYADARVTATGQSEMIGYFLNSSINDYACVFLDRVANLRTIHATRPLLCRLFDCDREGREQLIELGIRTPGGE